MKVLITGATGLIGATLATSLESKGHTVTRLVRQPPAPGSNDVQFDPQSGIVSTDSLEGADAVVHLAGENIAQKWTPEARKRIRASRIQTTELLCETLAQLDQKPQVLVSASAIGFYGNRGDDVLTEDSPPGAGFLSEICQGWETATKPADEANIRVVNLRLGVVLSPQGGALAKMLLPFRLGVGGKIGNGQQYMSWITLDDALGVIEHILNNTSLGGPVNTVSPQSVTNSQFTRTLGQALNRPALFTVPAFAIRAALGEMGEETLLASTRVEPAQLKTTGYVYQHPDLEQALQQMLGNK